MNQIIFKNKEYQNEFNRQGFITLPLLDSHAIDALNNLFDELHKDLPTQGFVTSGYSNDYNYKLESSKRIVALIESHINKLFENIKPIGASFSFKIPSPESDFNLHQDWTVVDEEKDISINIWIPLCDTNIENGTLFVMPGSHYTNFPVHRSPTIGFVYNTPQKESIIKQKLVPLLLKAGSAVVINHSLIHYSPPNLSKNIRKAIIAGYTNKGAEMYFLYKKPKAVTVDRYKISSEFYYRFTNFHEQVYQRPQHAEYDKSISYKLPHLNLQDLDKLTDMMLQKAGFPPKKSNIKIPVGHKIVSFFKRKVI